MTSSDVWTDWHGYQFVCHFLCCPWLCIIKFEWKHALIVHRLVLPKVHRSKKMTFTSPTDIPAVLASSSDNLTVDSDIGKPLLVASISGDQVTLFAMVITGSCPTVQWRVNASNISESDAHYTIGDPCPSVSSFNVSSYNFTLTITVTPMTAGTYTAILSNQAGTIEVPDVFVTPPGTYVDAWRLIQLATLTILMFLIPCSSCGYHWAPAFSQLFLPGGWKFSYFGVCSFRFSTTRNHFLSGNGADYPRFWLLH